MKALSYLKGAVPAIALLLGATGCQDDTENFGNSIFTPSLETVTTVNVKPTTTDAVGYVEASLAKKESQDITVTFAAAPDRTAAYNAIYSAECEPLPADYYTIPTPTATVPAGGNTTGKVEVKFHNLDRLDVSKTYVLPVVMTSQFGALSNDVYYFVIKEAALVSTVADMTDNYGIFSQGNQAPELEGITQITVEALLYPIDFPNMLATIMGIEGQFLVRIGDAGIPGNQLQLATSAGNVTDPAWTFDTGKWTFLTLTYDTQSGECKVYFNGVQKGSTQTGGYHDAVNWNTASGDITDGPRGFYVGYAYDPNRYFNGYMSELRVWRRVLTQEEINSPFHFYTVDPEAEDLAAYWKMDEGAGNNIHDYANGYDLTCLQAPLWIPVSLPAK